MNPYTWLWKHTTGRPFTYCIRDFYHNHPILTIFIIGWSIYLFNKYIHVGWESWLLITIGVLLGHLFWGTKYTPNQDANDSRMAPGESLSNYHENWREKK